MLHYSHTSGVFPAARSTPNLVRLNFRDSSGRFGGPKSIVRLPVRRTWPPCGAASTSAPAAVEEELTIDREDVVDAGRATFRRAGFETQAAAILATSSLLGFAVLSDDLPAIRLAILTYGVWAMGEWVVHRFFMHAKKGSFGDRVTHLNDLHVTHHVDTNKDMTMKNGFVSDALYFHLPNSALQIAVGTSFLLAADAALDLAIPTSWVPLAAVLGMSIHNTLWNTLHMDMHEVPGDYEDGLPCLPFSRNGPFRTYVQWVYDNHTTHHDVGGSANYNIITPGPDFLLGTYYHRSRSVNL